MSRDKIKSVSKYLLHKDLNYRLKALKKLKEYLSRGYDSELIYKYINAYIEKEKNEKLISYAKEILALKPKKERKIKNKGKRKNKTKLYLMFFVLAILTLIFIFFKDQFNQEQTEAPSSEGNKTSFFDKIGSIGGKKKEEQKVDLSEASNLILPVEIDIPKETLLKENVWLLFNPRRGKTYYSKIKVEQKSSSRGMVISNKEVRFKLRKRYVSKLKDAVLLGVKVNQVKGDVDSGMVGFPSADKEVFFEVTKEYFLYRSKDSLKKKLKIPIKNYSLPFPVFPKIKVTSGSTWGDKKSGKNIVLNTEYKLLGEITFKGKKLYKISLESISKTINKTPKFKVLSKGLFFLDKATAMPYYIKLKTISQTNLEGTGFPIENEITIEEKSI